MHEFSLMADLISKIENIAREQEAYRVVGVRVSLGALSHISPEHFREHFYQGVIGTVAEGAKLNIEVSTNSDDPHAQDVILKNVDVED